MVEIKKSYELPDTSSDRREWPFARMDVGDGFEVRDEGRFNTMRSYATRRGRDLGMKFRCTKRGGVLIVQRVA